MILELLTGFSSFEFRVASQILCAASPAFRDLPVAGPTGPTFKSACDRRSALESISEPWTIVTRGDNPNALAVLLYAIHLRGEKVPRVVSFDQLWELAILCDKYDCVSAMEPWIALWTRDPPQHKDNLSECIVKWLFMSWLFGLDELFGKVTREIILEGRYYGRVPSDDHLAMPSYVSMSDPRFLIPGNITCKSISSGTSFLDNTAKLSQPVSETAEIRCTKPLLTWPWKLKRNTTPPPKFSVRRGRKYVTSCSLAP